MLKTVVESLKVMGLEVPAWIGLLMLIAAIVFGVYAFISKKFMPWIKRMIKVQTDIMSIPELRESTNKCDKMIMDQINKMTEKFDTMYDNFNKMSEKFDLMQEEVEKNSKSQAAQCEALKMILANELDKKYRRYLELNYIPDKEFDEYTHMFESYTGLGGNSTGAEKYHYIMNNLPRKIS